MGSSAVRLSALSVDALGQVLWRDDQRHPLRLGTDVFAHGSIGADAQAQLLACMQTIQARLGGGGTPMRAIATSAMRDAQNGAELAAQVRAATGVPLRIVSGAVESRLARLALEHAVGSLAPTALFLDLGGGSLELQRAGASRGRSWPLGTVRLLAQFPALQGVLAGPQLAAATAAMAAHLAPYLRRLQPAPLLVGTGGNLEALAQILAVGSLPASLSTAALAALLPEMAALAPAARCRRFGLRPDRADLVVPALMVLLAVLRRCGSDTLLVPGTGLRDALLHGLLLRPAPRLPAGPGLEAVRWARALWLTLSPLHPGWPVVLAPMAAALAAAAGAPGPLARLEPAAQAWAQQQQQQLLGPATAPTSELAAVVLRQAWALRTQPAPTRAAPLRLHLWPGPARLHVPCAVRPSSWRHCWRPCPSPCKLRPIVPALRLG